MHMQQYGVREVEKILRLSRGTIRGLIREGFISPERGPRRAYRFSFQDLIVLRAARSLSAARVTPQRIIRSLRHLRRHLPEELPLSGLSIYAVGKRVVVREGSGHWQADSGQYLLGLDVTMKGGDLRIVEHPPTPSEPEAAREQDAEAYFEDALELEVTNPPAAPVAYRRAIELDPKHLAARINLGRLLHESGELEQAEASYRDALRVCGQSGVLLFNLGVVLEDRHESEAALKVYLEALADDPELHECHYNLARLYQALGKPQHAIRHLGQYRRLTTR